MKTILRHWPAVACLIFLAAAVYFAGDKLGDILVAFAIPIFFGFFYLLYVSFGKDEEEEGQEGLIERLQFFWFKLTMPGKKASNSAQKKKSP